jgi:prepilin-type N-terminal cleavage/methylation domain-containing protein
MRSQRPKRPLFVGRFQLPAFTLIELLVTVAIIAIIAIIAALLLPALARTKDSARSSVCVNNLHQIALASVTYSLDSNGKLPSFRDWLYSTKVGDLTTGRLYPYLKSKKVYQCPTDALNLAQKIKTGSPTAPSGIASRIATRDYSYGMNCEICHATDLARFLQPSQTMLYMEADLAANDYSGQVGPSMAARSLSFRHRTRGHLVMADLRVDTMDKKKFDVATKTKRFWYPTDDTSGPGGIRLGP